MSKLKFTTKVNILLSDFKIAHQSPILLLGSCFAQNIGNKLNKSKFNTITNPFGIIYNPISVIKELQRIANKKLYVKKNLTQFHDKWISFDHHGSFSSPNQEECLAKINDAIIKSYLHLKKTNTIFITFGTAWVYEYKNFGIVANCHKIPSAKFIKRLLSVKEILIAFNNVKEALKDFNIIFTVSPIRHVKDGLHENNLSKSVLHLVIKNITEQNKNCYYFPAYELIIDELRDYRFFKDDLIHPSEMAINYIWESFLSTYCNEETIEIINEIQKVKQAVNHKPFNFKSKEHQQFITQQLKTIEEISAKYPFLDFEEEKEKLIRI